MNIIITNIAYISSSLCKHVKCKSCIPRLFLLIVCHCMVKIMLESLILSFFRNNCCKEQKGVYIQCTSPCICLSLGLSLLKAIRNEYIHVND